MDEHGTCGIIRCRINDIYTTSLEKLIGARPKYNTIGVYYPKNNSVKKTKDEKIRCILFNTFDDNIPFIKIENINTLRMSKYVSNITLYSIDFDNQQLILTKSSEITYHQTNVKRKFIELCHDLEYRKKDRDYTNLLLSLVGIETEKETGYTIVNKIIQESAEKIAIKKVDAKFLRLPYMKKIYLKKNGLVQSEQELESPQKVFDCFINLLNNEEFVENFKDTNFRRLNEEGDHIESVVNKLVNLENRLFNVLSDASSTNNLDVGKINSIIEEINLERRKSKIDSIIPILDIYEDNSWNIVGDNADTEEVNYKPYFNNQDDCIKELVTYFNSVVASMSNNEDLEIDLGVIIGNLNELFESRGYLIPLPIFSVSKYAIISILGNGNKIMFNCEKDNIIIPFYNPKLDKLNRIQLVQLLNSVNSLREGQNQPSSTLENLQNEITKRLSKIN